MERLIKTPEWFKAPEARYPDLESVVRRIFASVEEAEDYGISIGVRLVHYEEHLAIAQLASEFLARLQDHRLPIPETLMAHTEFFQAKYPGNLSGIPAMTEGGVMFLNPSANYWKDPLEQSREAFAIQYWSTPSPLHVFFHEYAHLYHSQTTRNVQLTPKQKTITASISVRAGDNVEEFLSEVYAGLIEGVQYDSDILKVYHRLGGKKP